MTRLIPLLLLAAFAVGCGDDGPDGIRLSADSETGPVAPAKARGNWALILVGNFGDEDITIKRVKVITPRGLTQPTSFKVIPRHINLGIDTRNAPSILDPLPKYSKAGVVRPDDEDPYGTRILFQVTRPDADKTVHAQGVSVDYTEDGYPNRVVNQELDLCFGPKHRYDNEC